MQGTYAMPNRFTHKKIANSGLITMSLCCQHLGLSTSPRGFYFQEFVSNGISPQTKDISFYYYLKNCLFFCFQSGDTLPLIVCSVLNARVKDNYAYEYAGAMCLKIRTDFEFFCERLLCV